MEGKFVSENDVIERDDELETHEDTHENTQEDNAAVPDTVKENSSQKAHASVTFQEPANNNCSKCIDGQLLTKLFDNIEFSQSTENIIAVFWGAFIFFVGVVFVIAEYATHLKTYTFVSTYWVLFVFMVISIIAMSISIHHRNNENFIIENYDEDDEDEYQAEGTTSKYLIGNAYIFSIGNFLLDMFSIVTVFHCGMGKTSSKEKNEYAIKFIFHATRMVFTSVLLIFIQVFATSKIQRKFQLHFKIIIVHLMATNFNIWFTYLSQETGLLKGGTLATYGEYNLTCTGNKNDTFFSTAKESSEYLEPFILEFSLLTATICYSIYPAKDPVGREHGRRKYNYGTIDMVKRDDSIVYKSDPGLLFGIIIALLLVLSSWGLKDDIHYVENLRFGYSMQIIIHLLIIISSGVMLYEMRVYHTKDHPNRRYKIDDYLLLFTGLGGFLPFLIIVLFSITKQEDYSHSRLIHLKSSIGDDLNNHEKELRALLGMLSVINTVAVLVQMFFLLTAHSYKRVAFSNRITDSSADFAAPEKTHKKLRSSARITQWLAFLLALNLALWVTDSFFEIKGSLEKTYWISLVFWGDKVWLFITRLLYPVLIFFRFHSSAMIINIWLNFQIKKKIF